MAGLRVQIIVLNFNGMEILPLCLPSLERSASQASFPTSVTLLDNRSTDGSVAWVRKNFPRVRVVVASENRFLVSFNQYVQQIEDDIVVLMNNDIRVDTHFVDPLIHVFERYPDAFLACPQSFSFDGKQYEGGRTRAEIRWGLFWSSATFAGCEALREKAGYTFSSGFGAFHRKRFAALGGYDDLYLPGIMEDADLGFRAWGEGHRSYYVPESHVYHLGQASFRKAFGQKGILRLAHRNGFLFVWKNISDPLILFQHFLLLLPRLVFAFFKGKPEMAVGFIQALGRLPEAWGKRRLLKRARNDGEIFALANERPRRRHYVFKKQWKRILASLFDTVGTLLFGTPLLLKRRMPLDPKRILVIRLDSMGDGVLTLPALQALRRRFPEARIDFLAGPLNQDLFGHFFPKSEIYSLGTNWTSKGVSLPNLVHEFVSSASKIRKGRYDLGIDFRGDLKNILLMSASGIRQRWGRGGTGGGFLLQRERNPSFEQHEAVANLSLVEDSPEPAAVEFPHADSPAHGGSPGERRIVIHLGAGYPSKRWAPERFIEVARGIDQKKWGMPVFIGSVEERKLLDSQRSHPAFQFRDLTGQTSFEELMAVIAEADLFIGNDSGPAHLAALLGRKLVVVFSGTNSWRQWAPWSAHLRLLHHPVPCSPCEEQVCPLRRQHCLEEITVEEVLRAVEEMLTR